MRVVGGLGCLRCESDGWPRAPVFGVHQRESDVKPGSIKFRESGDI